MMQIEPQKKNKKGHALHVVFGVPAGLEHHHPRVCKD